MFSLIYLMLGTLYVFSLVKMARRGPEPPAAQEAQT